MLELKNVTFGYGVPKKSKPIISDLSLSILPGERLELSAPSGFGKTTLCRLIAGYEKPWSGEVLVCGKSLPKRGRLPVQLILQHPEVAVDPRMRMEDMLAEAGDVSSDLIERFGIKSEWMRRFPHELSGGELQRFCIVRALAANPQYLIADEISTMLDAITQAQIWHALLDEAEIRNFGMVFVTHDPSLSALIATRKFSL